jgi:DNA-binding response OmpR family regulator
MKQVEERVDRASELMGAEREAIVFVSASAGDARALREIAGLSRWLVVNVPDLAGARAVVDKLRPRLVVCDTEIEGHGTWRDLLTGPDSEPRFLLVVASRLADEALWSEVLNLGGLDLLRKPFAAEEVARVLGLGLQDPDTDCSAAAHAPAPLIHS